MIGPIEYFASGVTAGHCLRVKLVNGVLQLAGTIDVDIGTLELPVVAGQSAVPVRMREATGFCSMIAADAIGVGADVYSAANGQVSSTAGAGSLLLGQSFSTGLAGWQVVVLRSGMSPDLFSVKYQPVRFFAPSEATTGIDLNVIAAGDFLWMESGVVYGTQWIEDMLSEAANQEYAHDRFCGVALESYDGAVGGKEILTATAGEFPLPCTLQTFETGDMVGIKEQPNGTNLYANTVTRVVAAPHRSIGYVTKREPVAVTTVRAAIRSTVIGGGPQVMA